MLIFVTALKKTFDTLTFKSPSFEFLNSKLLNYSVDLRTKKGTITMPMLSRVNIQNFTVISRLFHKRYVFNLNFLLKTLSWWFSFIKTFLERLYSYEYRVITYYSYLYTSIFKHNDKVHSNSIIITNLSF